MKGRRSPIDRMRELADDGLEPWQIAAALGVREDAVLVALAAAEPAGGAQRAVEDASSLVPAPASDPVENHATEAPWEHPNRALPADPPSKPDTLAPARPLRTRLVEHVAALADHADGIAEEMTTALGLPDGMRLAFSHEAAPVQVEFDPDDASTYPCATGGDCGCTDTGLTSCPGGDEDRVEAARRARDEAADRVLDALAVANSATAAEIEALEVVEYSGVQTLPASLVAPPEPDPEHVHDPFPVADETGVWHAECECGHRWDRAPCEYSGCTAYVAALHIARTGTSRHAHHPPA